MTALWTYVRRNAALVAAVVWFLLLSPLGQAFKARAGKPTVAWATIGLVATAVVLVGVAVVVRRSLPADATVESAAPRVLPVAVAPALVGAAFGFAGAARWSLLAAWLVTGGLLGWWAVTVAADARTKR